MAVYKVFFRKSVAKDLEDIPKSDVKKIMSRIRDLSLNPRGHGCEKLSGRDAYRIRQGRYRVVYSIHDDVLNVWVVKIAHRKDVYRQ